MEPADFLSLVIETSITIAGFTGIVIVLGRRAAGEWSARDRIQLRALLLSTMTPIAISGLGLLLITTEMPLVHVWRIISAFTVVLYCFHMVTGLRRAHQVLDKEFLGGTLYLLLSLSALVSLVVAANALVLATFWPIALLLTWMIGLSLFNFIQLLWRATVEGGS